MTGQERKNGVAHSQHYVRDRSTGKLCGVILRNSFGPAAHKSNPRHFRSLFKGQELS